MLMFVRFIIFLLASVLPAATCWSGTMSIGSRTTLTIPADHILADVYAENFGNEPAYTVRARLYIFDREYSADTIEQMRVGQKHTFRFKIPLPPDKKGEYPFVGEVLYHDFNRRPMTALTAGVFRLGPPGESRLSGQSPTLDLNKSRNLSVTVSSRDPAYREVAATLYLPRSLSTPQNRKHIRLKPFETATIGFSLTHHYGIDDATYPVFCVLVSNDSGEAHAAVVQTTVHVKEFQNWFIRTRWYWLSAGGLIVLGWVWIGVRPKKEVEAEVKVEKKAAQG